MKFTIFACVLLALYVSSCAALGASYFCIRSSGKECFITGIEGTHCGYKGSSTRKCNVFGKNCNYCDTDLDAPGYVDVQDNLTAWCISKGGSLRSSGLGYDLPDC